MTYSKSQMIAMKLHDQIQLDDGTIVTRVPNGWVYRFTAGSETQMQFVPEDVGDEQATPNRFDPDEFFEAAYRHIVNPLAAGGVLVVGFFAWVWFFG